MRAYVRYDPSQAALRALEAPSPDGGPDRPSLVPPTPREASKREEANQSDDYAEYDTPENRDHDARDDDRAAECQPDSTS